MIAFRQERAGARVIACLLVLALALAGLEIAFRVSDLRRRLDAEETFVSMEDNLAAAAVAPDVIAIGNSRVYHGVDPSIIERLVKRHARREIVAWNLGRGGIIATAQLAMLRRALDGPRPPRLVLLYVEPAGFLRYTSPELGYEVLTKPWRLGDLPSLVRAGAGAEELFEVAAGALLSTMRHRGRILDVLVRGERPGKAEPMGRHGFKSPRPVNGETQHKLAVKRGEKYRKQYDGPSSGYRLSELKLGSLRESLRLCREAGVKAVIVASPSTATVRKMASGPKTVVPLFDRAMKAIAREARVPYLDHSSPPVLTDDNYADGNHMDRIGAARYTTWLTYEVILPVAYGVHRRFDRWDVPHPSAGCEIVFDFEERRASGWERRGSAFKELLASGRRGLQRKVDGFKGLGLLSSYDRKTGGRATGEATSPPFTIAKRRLRFLVGGGAKGVSVDLIVDGETARTKSGPAGRKLSRAGWNVSDLAGRTARLRVVDASRDASGFVLLDQVEQCD
jgi:hypothetical protein